ncbi:MAG: radical SAM-associated putative lipoprotein [Tannerella sp.]|jgi:putative lipoprotein (rSAM/lipoprotein system)|nr:radical SAM-associated putative lipoprotein [Tannerella sp.]
MKKINRSLIRNANRILAGILALLGFGGCEKKEVAVPEYGTPRADYTVKGVVVNRATGRPVKNIRVSYTALEQTIVEYGVPPVTYSGDGPFADDVTGSDGTFKITQTMFAVPANPVPVYVEDTDGEANGLFEPDSLTVDFRDAGRSGERDGWYDGEYTVDVKVELTEKQTDE